MMTANTSSKKMTKPANEQLQCLIEVFPTWKPEDLNTILNEVGGDAYLAISRISEGHVSQWSDGKKTAPSESTFTSQKTQNNQNTRNDQTKRRTERLPRKTDRPPQKTTELHEQKNTVPKKVSQDKAKPSEKSLPKAQTSVVSPVIAATKPIDSTKKSFADALSFSTKPINVKKVESLPVEKVEAPVKEEESVAVEQPAVSPVVEEVPSIQSMEEVPVNPSEPAPSQCEESCACSAEVNAEDDCVVKLPSRQNMPSLTMEQPAVILPIRVPMRTGLSVRFGFDREEGVEAPSVNTSSLASIEPAASPELIAAPKTSISVAALESSFAMLSAVESAKNTSKSPEPALFEPATTPSYLQHSNSPSQQPQQSPYGRGRSGWDYETTATAASSSSFGPAPGFSNSSSSSSSTTTATANVNPRVNRSTNYDSGYASGYTTGSNRYASGYDYQSHQAEMHQGFIQSVTTSATDANNVSQYYTSNRGNIQSVPTQSSSGYPMYHRQANSFNNAGNRYSNGLSRGNAPTTGVSSAAAPYYQPQQQHYTTQYSAHQSYLNSYHHPHHHNHQGGYHHPSAQDQSSSQQHHQQHHQSHIYSHQPYYQPYQPPHQYLSNNNPQNPL